MKQRWLAAGIMLSILLLLLAGAVSYAEESTLPRVEMKSLDETDILSLERKQVTVHGRLTFSSDTLSFSWPVEVKLQGNFTLAFEKKNYTVKFYKDESFQEKKKVTVTDLWGKHSKYCLKANVQDNTQSRNIVSCRLAAEMNRQYGIFPQAPNNGLVDGFPVELYIDGDYRGIYTWNIPKDAWMFGMKSNSPDQLLMTGYNVEAESVYFRKEATGQEGKDWDMEEGPKDDPAATAEAFEKLNRLIRFVMNSTDEEFREHFSEYLNLDAMLNYYCFVYYTNTSDNMAKNLLLATMDGKVWYPCLYDLDTAFGLYFGGDGLYSPVNRAQDFQGGHSLLWERLVKNFPKELAQRYAELRKTILNEEHIMTRFEEFCNGIPAEAWERERQRWPDTPGREFGLDSIREHIREREGFVDGIFSQMYAEKKTYDDPDLLYRLEEPFIGKPNGYLDTGINLYSEDTDYTILLKMRTGQQEEGSKTILSNADNEGNGLIVQCAGDGTDQFTMFYAGQRSYEAVYAMDDDGYAIVAIRKNGDTYTFFGRNAWDQREFTSPMPGKAETNLVLGAQYIQHSDGQYTGINCYMGEIRALYVYNRAMDEMELDERMLALKAE